MNEPPRLFSFIQPSQVHALTVEGHPSHAIVPTQLFADGYVFMGQEQDSVSGSVGKVQAEDRGLHVESLARVVHAPSKGVLSRVTLAGGVLGIDAQLGAEPAPDEEEVAHRSLLHFIHLLLPLRFRDELSVIVADHITFGEQHGGDDACAEERKRNTNT